MLSLQDTDNIVLNGGIVVDSDGEKIGSVEQIFTSGDSGDPAFVTVRTGLFGMSESFAPLSGASLEESVIRVAFAKDTIKNGPRIDSNRGVITATQEQELYRYYGLEAEADAAGEGSSAWTSPDRAIPAAGATAAAKSTANATAHDGVTDAAGTTPAGEVPHPSMQAHGGPHPDGGPPHPQPHPPAPPRGGQPHSPPHLRKHVPPGVHPLPAEGTVHPPHRPPAPPHPGPGPNQ